MRSRSRAGMPTPWSRTPITTSSSPPPPVDPPVVVLDPPRQVDRLVLVGELHGVLQQVVDGGIELAPIAEHGDRRGRLAERYLDPPGLRRLPHPLDRFGEHEVDEHGLAWR